MKNIKDKEEEKIYEEAAARMEKTRPGYGLWDSAHKWIKRFIRKHKGKSYDKTYSEFLEKVKSGIKDFPERISSDCTLESMFRDFFELPFPDFMVENGIIKECPPRHRNPVKEKYIYEYPEGHKYRYVLKDKYRNDLEFMSAVYNYFGKKVYSSVSDSMTEAELKSVKAKMDDSFKYKIWFREHYYNRCYDWVCASDVFQKIDLAPVKKVKYTREMRKRDNAEALDARSKKYRLANAEKERIASTLLHDIKYRQKQKEEEKNKVDMERLGFDDQSFKGEFYHGEKRKKK